MNPKRNSAYPGYAGQLQRGFSLIELMIAITLSLVVAFAVSSIFVGSRQGYRTQTGFGQVQEEGRHAQLLITPIVRMAGYLPNPAFQPNPTVIFQSAQNKRALFGTYSSAPTSGNYPGFGTPAVASGTDTLILTYAGQDSSNQSTLFTCLGDAITASQTVTTIFYVSQADNTGASSLYCYTNVTTLTGALSSTTGKAQPLIAGVSNMAVLYGVDTDNDGVPNRYYNATNVPDWTAVNSVQITLTIDSADVVEAAGGASSTAVTSGGVTGSGRVRRTFSTTIQIRNRLTT